MSCLIIIYWDAKVLPQQVYNLKSINKSSKQERKALDKSIQLHLKKRAFSSLIFCN